MKKTVLLYSFTDEELGRLRRAILPLKFSPKAVTEQQQDLSVGFLAGVSDDDSPREKTETCPGRLVVMCGLVGGEVDKLLAALRKAGFPRDVLKAVLTPTNAEWSGAQLYSEILAEHMLMHNS